MRACICVHVCSSELLSAAFPPSNFTPCFWRCWGWGHYWTWSLLIQLNGWLAGISGLPVIPVLGTQACAFMLDNFLYMASRDWMQVRMCSQHFINKSSPQPFSGFYLLVLISSFGGGFVVYIYVGDKTEVGCASFTTGRSSYSKQKGGVLGRSVKWG